MISIKNSREIELMRIAGKVVGEVLDLMAASAVAGVSTKELDRIAERHILSRGCKPSFKGYNGFPATICASINNQVIHGIPSSGAILRDGDIVGIDVGAIYQGYHGDAARTFAVGAAATEALNLIKVTRQSFYEGIKYAKAGGRIGDIGAAIQAHAEAHGYSIVREATGHGIGKHLHEDPSIPNYGTHGRGVRIESGMTLAIEPMVNAGGHKVKQLADGWTLVTADGTLSAHFEHTVLVTDGEPEILTAGEIE